jgi:hypothetical protein
MDKY